MFGWKGDSLQRAVNARCMQDVCSELKSQSAEDSEKCTISQTMKEDVNGDECEFRILYLLDRILTVAYFKGCRTFLAVC